MCISLYNYLHFFYARSTNTKKILRKTQNSMTQNIHKYYMLYNYTKKHETTV